MKRLKKIIINGILFTLMFSLCACGERGERPAGEKPVQTVKPDNNGQIPAASEPIATTKEPDETESPAIPESTPEPEFRPPVLLSPGQGREVSLLNEEMTGWFKNYKPASLDKLCDFTEKCEPVPVTFKWNSGGADYCHLFVSENENMTSPLVILTLDDEADAEDLLPGRTYYWRVESSKDGKNEKSEIRTFTTLDAPRTVYIPDVSNVRDLGGKTSSDGRKTRFGIIYRGADFYYIKEKGIHKAVDILGIKTELDLRSRVTGGKSPLGDGIKYLSVTGPYYSGVFADSAKAELADEIRAFADGSNFPIYFHCSLGRDRTGTLAFLLLALCGVSEEEIKVDYEISAFSDLGKYEDRAAPSYMVTQLDAFKNQLMKDKTKTLAENTEDFLIGIGLTREELDAVKNNILEG